MIKEHHDKIENYGERDGELEMHIHALRYFKGVKLSQIFFPTIHHEHHIESYR